MFFNVCYVQESQPCAEISGTARHATAPAAVSIREMRSPSGYKIEMTAPGTRVRLQVTFTYMFDVFPTFLTFWISEILNFYDNQFLSIKMTFSQNSKKSQIQKKSQKKSQIQKKSQKKSQIQKKSPKKSQIQKKSQKKSQRRQCSHDIFWREKKRQKNHARD